MKEKIKVLLIEDSPLILKILRRILDASNEVVVVGTARNGKEGLHLVQDLNPDVICTDFIMPVMDGLEFTKELMSTNPKPILVISSAFEGSNDSNVFNLLKAGALEIFPKPTGIQDSDYDMIREKLVSRIKIVKSIPVYKKNRQAEIKHPSETETSIKSISHQQNKFSYIVIGASTGGPNAIQKILFDLPRDISVPIICVQHISDGYIESFTSWLSTNCKLKVKIFSDGEKPQPGYVYFPQNMKHLIIKDDGKLYLSNEAAYNGHCPSINVAFESFAKHFASKTLGIILTGMGDDGAKGILSIKTNGGMTIGEDETTCTVYGMPRVAKELGALNNILPLNKIADKILSSI